ncbi:hypothetical protein NPIL_205311 [Nephila pilipes]|uniref:Uncharacterized protein n=1 Tax=Nephila pilipes TaxID=299642 RepID=A0A8X6K7K5_NEPPI|nr:hypothetical protein NPIL_205311 [Nephila pilipes]
MIIIFVPAMCNPSAICPVPHGPNVPVTLAPTELRISSVGLLYEYQDIFPSLTCELPLKNIGSGSKTPSEGSSTKASKILSANIKEDKTCLPTTIGC